MPLGECAQLNASAAQTSMKSAMTAPSSAAPLRIAVASPENLGFAAGMNAAIARTEAPFVLTLNADARPAPDYVTRLLARDLPFGNDPEDQSNRQTSDFLVGHGRVFFRDPDEHLFEVMASDPAPQ